jgi:hypothetical protein
MSTRRNAFTLNLVPWQSRLAKDFLDLNYYVDAVVINPGVIECPASYKIPPDGLSRRDWVLYLTDEQMKIVQQEFDLKEPVSGINITDKQIKKGDVAFQERKFSLKLEAWQARMAQDFLGTTKFVEMVEIKPGVIYCPASYKIPVEGLSRRDWVLYLTDEQMKIVQKAFDLRETVSGINITEAQIRRSDIVFR